jgi:anti-sigma regulatory factor (Ser/Thr protein kinase)
VETAQRFVHQALIYASREEFLAATVPFIQAGLAKSEPIFVLTDPAKLALLRDALGDGADGVSLEDNANWYDLPARALSALYRLHWERQKPGRRIRVIGEPIWSGRSDAQVREWKRYESLVNVAYARFPILALCLYDAEAVPATILADAYRTHPELLNGSNSVRSPEFVDPRIFIRELDRREALAEPGGNVHQLVFTGDLSSLRQFVVDEARQAGITGSKLQELEWVANEIATNVLQHADGTAMVRAWSEPEAFVCEISDRGPGLKDPLVAHLPPSADQEGPSGLWLAHQLCDVVEIHSSASGVTTRLHVRRDAGSS